MVFSTRPVAFLHAFLQALILPKSVLLPKRHRYSFTHLQSYLNKSLLWVIYTAVTGVLVYCYLYWCHDWTGACTPWNKFLHMLSVPLPWISYIAGVWLVLYLVFYTLCWWHYHEHLEHVYERDLATWGIEA
jgi:hypothetical protein